ncbi:hypothetical protein AVEN_197806-1 [Araneus ventricosus]|uniref:Uncharacterized protein n=1 Tax=Araneus ventricosus TaxID=182803 RepID=A0A4Y2TSB1_ARAVE|nr:hypothetical protein AVEN_197806-1 [Araneus ventricosus]
MIVRTSFGGATQDPAFSTRTHRSTVIRCLELPAGHIGILYPVEQFHVTFEAPMDKRIDATLLHISSTVRTIVLFIVLKTLKTNFSRYWFNYGFPNGNFFLLDLTSLDCFY